MKQKEIDTIEMDLLLEGILRRYGYDFRHYAQASLKRRLRRSMQRADLEQTSQMIPMVLHDEEFFDALLRDLSITVTEMFRDPDFYQAVRRKVVPVLKTYPFIKIWHPGCATGEEVYSMAIVLQEEGFLQRSQIYATDFNTHSLKVAREGIYPLERMQKFAHNYEQSGGAASFSDYYEARYGAARLTEPLRRNITFAYHNLVADGVFGEMNLIVCRNVLIYFDRHLQDRVLGLFSDSLCRRGFLCLGTKETVEFSTVNDRFELLSRKQKVYQKRLEEGAEDPLP